MKCWQIELTDFLFIDESFLKQCLNDLQFMKKSAEDFFSINWKNTVYKMKTLSSKFSHWGLTQRYLFTSKNHKDFNPQNNQKNWKSSCQYLDLFSSIFLYYSSNRVPKILFNKEAQQEKFFLWMSFSILIITCFFI